MELNPDCVRDLMLFLEEHTTVSVCEEGSIMSTSFRKIRANDICKFSGFQKYSSECIVYHIVQLSESGYIATNFVFDPAHSFGKFETPCIYYMTPKGHELTASLKDNERWGGTAKVLKKLGGVSLSIIEAVSRGATGALIDKYAPSLVPDRTAVGTGT